MIEWRNVDTDPPQDGQECIFCSLSMIPHAGRFLDGTRMGRSGPMFQGVGIGMCKSVVAVWAELPVPSVHVVQDAMTPMEREKPKATPRGGV